MVVCEMKSFQMGVVMICDVESRLSHKAHFTVKATKAARFLTTVSDWGNGGQFRPRTYRGLVNISYYKHTLVDWNGDKSQMSHVALGQSAPDVVELEQIVSIPVRQGVGTRMMKRLCALADELNLTLWLEACPHGTVGVMLKEENLSVAKLIQWYSRFGFFRISSPQRSWLNGWHQQYYRRFNHPMMRNPMSMS